MPTQMMPAQLSGGGGKRRLQQTAKGTSNESDSTRMLIGALVKAPIRVKFAVPVLPACRFLARCCRALLGHS
jgi:hypothetical protein